MKYFLLSFPQNKEVFMNKKVSGESVVKDIRIVLEGFRGEDNILVENLLARVSQHSYK